VDSDPGRRPGKAVVSQCKSDQISLLTLEPKPAAIREHVGRAAIGGV